MSVFNSPLFFQRVFIFIICIFLALSFVAEPAQAAAKRAYAGIVVDAKSGKTLYSRAADSPRYPASLTKVMTLYIVFQELEAGRLRLSTKMRVSKHASNAVPSKLGLRPGSTISVENAIKALVTKSANDVARVIAEHISGSESKFAVRMTKTARALGMKRTTYANASGLPNSRQVTTVRDQSRLGIAVYQHFPKYYKYFQTRSFKYKGKTYGNHNRLLGQNGVDGIKTGYIRASGFNLLTAARINNRHIVVVAFGFDSGNARNAKVASLVKNNLKKARRGGYVAQARIAKPNGMGVITRVATKVTPMPRLASRMPNLQASNLQMANAPVPASPIILTQPQTINVANVKAPIISPNPMARPINLLSVNTQPAQTQQIAIDLTNVPPTRVNLALVAPVRTSKPSPAPTNALDIIGKWIMDSRDSTNRQGGALALMPPSNIGSNIGSNISSSNQSIDLMTSGSIGEEKQEIETGWVVQIGAANSNERAISLISNAKNKLPELNDLRSNVQISKKNGQEIYRARFLGFGNKNSAQSACKKLKSKKVSCLLVQS